MTREEEIENAAIKYHKDIDYSDYADMDVYDAFIAGAEWADTHPSEFVRLENVALQNNAAYLEGFKDGQCCPKFP